MNSLEILLTVYTITIVLLCIVVFATITKKNKYKQRYKDVYNEAAKLKESVQINFEFILELNKSKLQLLKELKLRQNELQDLSELEETNEALEKKVILLDAENTALKQTLISKEYPLAGLCQKCIKSKKSK